MNLLNPESGEKIPYFVDADNGYTEVSHLMTGKHTI